MERINHCKKGISEFVAVVEFDIELNRDDIAIRSFDEHGCLVVDNVGLPSLIESSHESIVLLLDKRRHEIDNVLTRSFIFAPSYQGT